MTKMGTAASRASQQTRRRGLASLTAEEKKVLGWSQETRLEEFQRVNEGVDRHVLETKLMYIDSITLDNAEVLDVLNLNPTLSWEKVRDVFLGGPVDGYTSTFHGLDDIDYPEHFWKAIIESERDKLQAAGSEP